MDMLAQFYLCTAETLTKRFKKKVYGDYTKILHTVSNKYWKWCPIECEVKWSEVGNRCRGRPEGPLFNSYYTEV